MVKLFKEPKANVTINCIQFNSVLYKITRLIIDIFYFI